MIGKVYLATMSDKDLVIRIIAAAVWFYIVIKYGSGGPLEGWYNRYKGRRF